MKFNKNILKEKWAAYTVAACSAVLLYMLLTHLGTLGKIFKGLLRICAPVILAFVIAYILDPLVTWYSKNVLKKVKTARLRHTLSVLLSVLTVVLFIAVLMVALVPQIIDSIVLFAKNLNGYVRSFQRLMSQLSHFASRYDIDLSKFISSSDELLQSITRILPENVNKIVNASFGFGRHLFDWIISFILAIYLMLDNHKLKKGFDRLLKALLPDHVYRSSATFWSRCNSILVEYIAFDILDGLIIGVLNWIFMVIMDMPYVAIISVIVGVTNLAPTFGPMVGAAIGAFILVLVNPWDALWFLLFTLVLQTFDGYILKPRLFGEKLGVSAVWILISLIIGGRFLGVAGILLAIPFAAIGDFIYHDYIIKRLEKRKKEAQDHELAGRLPGTDPAARKVKEINEIKEIHEIHEIDETHEPNELKEAEEGKEEKEEKVKEIKKEKAEAGILPAAGIAVARSMTGAVTDEPAGREGGADPSTDNAAEAKADIRKNEAGPMAGNAAEADADGRTGGAGSMTGNAAEADADGIKREKAAGRSSDHAVGDAIDGSRSGGKGMLSGSLFDKKC